LEDIDKYKNNKTEVEMKVVDDKGEETGEITIEIEWDAKLEKEEASVGEEDAQAEGTADGDVEADEEENVEERKKKEEVCVV
jgi:hypothetical protein